MAADTIPFKKLIEQSGDFFELVVAIAKRARQINDEQKIFIEREAGIDNSYDDDDEEPDYTGVIVVTVVLVTIGCVVGAIGVLYWKKPDEVKAFGQKLRNKLKKVR